MGVDKLKLAVLISGRGSNLQALIDACKDPLFPAEIVLVLSNRPQAQGLDYARAAGLPVLTVDHKNYPDRESFDDAVHDEIVKNGADLVALAGFMRILTPGFVNKWPRRMINIHPSLLPAYKGLHTHERALADGADVHGCTVHHVTAELDAGPIILQAKVPVLAGDTPDTLAARVLTEEHRIYPQALAMLARELQAKTSI